MSSSKIRDATLRPLHCWMLSTPWLSLEIMSIKITKLDKAQTWQGPLLTKDTLVFLMRMQTGLSIHLNKKRIAHYNCPGPAYKFHILVTPPIRINKWSTVQISGWNLYCSSCITSVEIVGPPGLLLSTSAMPL